MKKFLVLMFMIFAVPCFAFETDVNQYGKAEKIIRETGFRILNSNKLTYRATFLLNTKNTSPNAWARYSDNVIVFNKTTFNYLDTDDEIAAILAHEIAHGEDYRTGVLKGYFTFIPMSFCSKKYELKADLRGVDFMVKAGYHPVAMIVALNKIAGETRYCWYSSHPNTSKRLIKIYEYIYSKYPEYLVNNKYKDDIYYQNFLLNSREERQKLQEK